MPNFNGIFDAHEALRMREAFASAWGLIERSGSAVANPDEADRTRELLALKIISLARQVDPAVLDLRDEALRYFGFVSVDFVWQAEVWPEMEMRDHGRAFLNS